MSGSKPLEANRPQNAHKTTFGRRPLVDCRIRTTLRKNSMMEHDIKNYYVPESVGIATGILLTALHVAGLANTYPHTKIQ